MYHLIIGLHRTKFNLAHLSSPMTPPFSFSPTTRSSSQFSRCYLSHPTTRENYHTLRLLHIYVIEFEDSY